MYRMDWSPWCLNWVFIFRFFPYVPLSIFFVYTIFCYVIFVIVYFWSSVGLSGLVAALSHSLYSTLAEMQKLLFLMYTKNSDPTTTFKPPLQETKQLQFYL